MVKLTPDLIDQCAQFTNPVRDRELDLRGYKIPVIENLGATLDQFDTIDLSDNEIRKMDGFPLLKRLKNLMINNNRITRLGEHLEECLPSLESVILTNNNLTELGDIDNLATVKTLTTVCFLRNPVTTKKNYRLYVVHKLPQVRLIDFQKVKLKEREAASKLFKGKKGAQLARDMGGKRAKTFVPGAAVPSGQAAAKPTPAPQEEGPKHDIQAIKAAIANAKTLEEVERLNHLLQTGQVPSLNGADTQDEPMEQ